MKYSVLEHRGISIEEKDNTKRVVNVGDAFQIMAVKHLYSQMDIPLCSNTPYFISHHL